MRPKIKICGITRLEDALLAERLGADFIGLIFTKKSPRQISVETARTITRHLKVARAVGVFVEQDFHETITIANATGLHGVQHYTLFNQKPESCIYIHACAVKDGVDQNSYLNPVPDYNLLDTYACEQHGGTGKSFDWSLIPEQRNRLFLAGGIGPKNITAAMAIKPYAIDLSSGVEERPGVKSAEKMKHLFAEIDHGG